MVWSVWAMAMFVVARVSAVMGVMSGGVRTAPDLGGGCVRTVANV